MGQPPRGRRALVTGAGGFLGSHLARSLVADGWRVTALLRSAHRSPRLDDVQARIEFVIADIRDRAALAEAVRVARPDVVYHLAADTAVRRFDGEWEVVDRAIATNFDGTLNLLHAAQVHDGGIDCLIRTGGLEEYGRGAVPAAEAQREQPTSPYSASQTAATHWCQMLQPYLPFTVATLRPAVIYGPDQGTDFLIPALIAALLEGRRFAIRGGDQRRDYVYVDDVVTALRTGHERAARLRGAVVNVASGRERRVRDVARLVARLMDREDLLDEAPEARTAGLDTVLGDGDLAAEVLDWRPRIDMTEGLRRTIDWHAGRR